MLSTILIWVSSITSMAVITAVSVRSLDWYSSMFRFTASALKGSPSANFTFSRRVQVMLGSSASISQPVASSPTVEPSSA